ncbi:uncharacterized protein BJX67DRAFT_313945 [Aspergillus lucknowensis]|uniref:Uncharacterized protein n=1 Tax=Aspergillus lucknowensis TaxID=176173 RepID=A0ABR4L9C9_9EURO
MSCEPIVEEKKKSVSGGTCSLGFSAVRASGSGLPDEDKRKTGGGASFEALANGPAEVEEEASNHGNHRPAVSEEERQGTKRGQSKTPTSSVPLAITSLRQDSDCSACYERASSCCCITQRAESQLTNKYLKLRTDTRDKEIKKYGKSQGIAHRCRFRFQVRVQVQV